MLCLKIIASTFVHLVCVVYWCYVHRNRLFVRKRRFRIHVFSFLLYCELK